MPARKIQNETLKNKAPKQMAEEKRQLSWR